MERWRGSVFPRKKKLVMAVKVDGRWKQVPTPYRPGEEDKALALLKRTREMLLAGEDAGLGPAPTVREYATRTWLSLRRAQGVASWGDDDSRLQHHVFPVLGEMPLLEVRATSRTW